MQVHAIDKTIADTELPEGSIRDESLLNDQLDSVDNTTTTTNKNKNNTTVISRRVDDVRRHVCKLCGRRFVRRAMLTLHMNVNHRDQCAAMKT